jgi:nucleoside-diphosphate-sugar epimerase
MDVVRVGDLGPETDWSEAVRGMDAVVHLAGRAHVMGGPAALEEKDFQRVNVGGTESLCRAVSRAGVQRIVFLSSVSVLGGRSEQGRPLTESSTLRPQSAYARSKRDAETKLFSLAKELGFEGVVVRPPLVYGPGAPGNFQRLATWVRAGVPLPFKSVDNRRSFVYVENLCDALSVALVHRDAAHRTFLVSDGQDLSTSEWIERVARSMGKSARLFPFPPFLLKIGLRALGRLDLSDKLLESFQVDSGAFRAAVGWSPPWGVDEALRATFSSTN